MCLYSDDSTLPRSLLALSQRDSSNEVFCFFDDLEFAGALAIAETIPLYKSHALPGCEMTGKGLVLKA